MSCRLRYIPILVLAAVGACTPRLDYGVELRLDEILSGAAVQTEAASIDIGAPESRVSMPRGWDRLDRAGDEVTRVRSRGRSSDLVLTVIRPRALTLTMYLRALRPASAVDRTMGVEMNGAGVGGVRLRSGDHEYAVEIPAFAVVRGDNVLRFEYPVDADGKPLVVLWDRVELEGDDVVVGTGLPHAEEDGSLWLPAGVRVSYYLELRPEVELVVDDLVREPADGHGSLWIDVDTVDAPHREERFSLPVDGEIVAPLGIDRPGPARVSLTFVSPGGGSDDAALRLARPRLRTTLPTPAAAIDEPAATVPYPRDDARPSVLVFLIDALRADHVGTYGYDVDTTPNIDEFARGSVVYEDAQAHASFTKTSVASLFTSHFPRTHGLLGRDHVIPEEAVTLAETMADAGYDTGGFVTITTVRSLWGFDQGFERYEDMLENKPVQVHQPANRVVDHALDWIRSRPEPETPFFAYVHVSEPHTPYIPRPEFHERFAPGVTMEFAASRKFKGPDADRTDLEGRLRYRDAIAALYDAEIAEADEAFGRLLDGLRETGDLDRTMIILVADHGEEFNDHGGWNHAQTLHQEVLHVPLIVRYPGAWAGGRRVAELARLIDVMPTILDAARVDAPAGMHGRSLIDDLFPAPAAQVPVASLAQMRWGKMDRESLITRDWKWMSLRDLEMPNVAARERWFDRRGDRIEVEALDRVPPFVFGYLIAEQQRLYELAPEAPPRDELDLDPEVEARMRALGYIR